MNKKAVDKKAAAEQRVRLGLPASMEEARVILEENQQLKFQAIIESVLTGTYLETAFMVAGISKKRAYEWFRYGNEGKEPYASFLVELRKAQGQAIQNDLSVIQLAAMRGDWRASAWRLERMYPQLYGQRIEITDRQDLDPDNAPMVGPAALDLERLSLREKMALRDLMSKADGVEDVIDVECQEDPKESPSGGVEVSKPKDGRMDLAALLQGRKSEDRC